jgi:hypothetical protein
MKLSKIILAVALPLVLTTGCALDVGTSSEGLTTETDSDFGINACGQTLESRLASAEWPLETIVAGDMEFTKEDLIEYFETNPGLEAELVAEIAVVQMDMAVGLEIPDPVLDGLIAVDELLMAPKDDDGSIPQLVNLDDFDSLRRFNRKGLGICFTGDTSVTAEVVGGTKDVRDDIIEEAAGFVDLRVNLSTTEE